MKYSIERINTMQPDFLSKAKKGGYICPECGNGSGADGTGITKKGSSTHYKCFKCGLYEDTFNLYCRYAGITDIAAAAESAYNWYNLQPEEEDAPPVKKEEAVPDPEADYTNFYHEAAKNNNFEYLEKRGISRETQQRFFIGYVEAWKHPKAPEQAPTSPRCIIPRSKTSYLARDIRPDAPKQYAKQNCGKVTLFNTKALKKENAIIFVTEGEIDALSVIECGADATALCSTSNKERFIELLKSNYKKQAIVLMLDNDDAGRNTAAAMAADLEKNNIPYIMAEYPGKDPNEAMQADLEAFKGIVREAQKKAVEAQQKALQEGIYNAAELLDYFRNIDKQPEGYEAKTGFEELDRNLSGGLHEGLYIIGAISSLGKTTFSLQVADQIAAAGQDVIFFSLEMSKFEIMAKSISRHTYKAHKDAKTAEGVYIARDTQQILNNRRYGAYSAQEREAITQAIETYGSQAKSLYIYEGRYQGQRLTVSAIREITKNHIEKTGRKPIIFIDYLQIIAPEDPRQTDKQNTDTAVFELKEISRDYNIPVFAISSFNRDNYSEPVSMTSFKESGAIEYSSDILFGLQYPFLEYVAREKDADRKTRLRENFEEVYRRKQSKQPIKVQLKCLKNRTGYNFNIDFDMVPAFNCFTECSAWKEINESDNPFEDPFRSLSGKKAK